jgi:hypothetical protein
MLRYGKPLTKIPASMLDPLDYLFVTLYAPFFDIFSKIGITPNMLTIIGGIIQLIGAYYLYNYNNRYAAFFWFWGYTFDIIDGCYARYTHNYSDFGDKLDHYKDFLSFFLYIIVGICKYNIKLIYIILIIVSVSCCNIHIGLTERHCKKEYRSKTMSLLVIESIPLNWIYYFKYMGPSMAMLVIGFIISQLEPNV